jgi:hypothetical protein
MDAEGEVVNARTVQMRPAVEFGVWEAVDTETGRRVACGYWEYAVERAARARGYEVRHWPPREAVEGKEPP